MKSVLEAIKKLHDSVIERILNVKEGVSATQVSGTTLKVSGVGKNFTEMRSRYQEVQNYRKTHNRFKNDPTKLVFEKETFFNILGKTKRCFLFRPINDNGDFYLPSDRVWLKVSSLLVFLGWLLLLNLGWVFGILIFRVPDDIVWGAGVFIASFILTAVTVLLVNRYLHKKWQEKYQNRPDITCAFTRYYVSGIGYPNANVSISTANTDMLKELMELAFKTGGKIIWLWDYTHFSNEGNFSITCPDEFVYVEIKDSSVYSLVPAVETDDSIIFSLKQFPSPDLLFENRLLVDRITSIEVDEVS